MKLSLLALLVVAGFAFRLETAELGETFDMTMCWRVNARLYNEGGYGAVLDRGALNNYPRPWWALIARLARVWPDDSQEFRMAVSAVISAFDVANGVLLYLAVGLSAAAFYLLCPLPVVIAGYAAQFDGIVLAFALAGALCIRSRHWVAGGLLLGTSITFKPVFVFLPAWLALRELEFRRPLVSLARATALGILGILPGALLLAIDHDRIKDIYESVVGGSHGWWMLPLWTLLPVTVQHWIGDPYRITFAALALGALFAPRDAVRALAWYAVLFIFTIPSWHNHHLVYVMGATAILGGWPLYLAAVLASLYILGDNNGLQMHQFRLWIPASPADDAAECIGNCDRRWIWEAITICLGLRLVWATRRRGREGPAANN